MTAFQIRRRARAAALCAWLGAALIVSGCAGIGGPSQEEQQSAALERQGQYQQAVALRQAIADTIERSQGRDSAALATALTNLVNDQLYLAETGQMFEHRNTQGVFTAAGSNAQRALEISERVYGKDDARLGAPLTQLGVVARFQGRPEESERFYRRALEIYRKAAPNNARAADVLWELAELDEFTMHFAEEEPLLREELAMREAVAGADSMRLAQSLDRIANFEVNRLGRYDLAEQYARRSLAIREKGLPPDDPLIGEAILGLAVVYQRQNRLADAEPLLKRAIAIKERSYGADSKEVAIALNLLAGIYLGLDRRADERDTLMRMLGIFRKRFGDDDADVAVALAQIADLDRREGHFADARAHFDEALAIAKKSEPQGNLTSASVEIGVAKLDLAVRRPADAEAAARRATVIFGRMAGPSYPDLIVSHDILARALLAQGRIDDAYVESSAALAGLRERGATQRTSRSGGALSERRSERSLFLDYVGISATLAQSDPARRAALESDAYNVAQLAQASSTADAVAGMAARFAAGDDALARVIRERQDAEARWRQLDGQLVQAAAQPADRRDAAHEEAIRAELAALDRELAAIDRRIAADFPGYAEIANPAPASLAATQKLLRAGEAMLVYMVGESETYIWALDPHEARMFRVKVGREELERSVVKLRRALDPSQLSISSPADIPPYDVVAAWQLYQSIFAPAEPLIGNARMVFIVPDAALQSLPFGVLVTQKPGGPVTDFAGYRSVPWLARRFATTNLPSVSSLAVLRAFGARSHAQHPFLGIGDPTLDGSSGAARGATLIRFFRGGIADVQTVRTLPALPESADELRAIGKELGAGPQDLVLRDRARKPAVMKLDFAAYRIVAFATHGLVAGDITGLAEPALVLTPPLQQAGADDDGLLVASDVSQLKFDADWVVLSACNTAAGDGSPDAEGLSGLAKAFFFAGSRTLLVSHWPVFSDATVKLTTGTFAELARDPLLPRAVALQRASTALREDPTEAYFAHPMFWAPFIVVGEGGAQ